MFANKLSNIKVLNYSKQALQTKINDVIRIYKIKKQ